MAKKRKGKHVSKRGHKEEHVIRFREKLQKVQYRIDENGNRIDTPSPVNTYSAEWMAKHLAGVGGKPPIDHSLTPPPDNVRSISSAKPKSDNKLEFDSPPSITHNPFIKPEVSAVTIVSANKKARGEFKPTRARYHSKGYAPPGLPSIFFTDGHFKPTEKSVVYTALQNNPATRHLTKNTPVRDAPPPTASKHWAGTPAANDPDNSVKVRQTSSVAWASKMKAHVQWFISNVEVQYWPSDVLKFAHWKPGDDGPVVNTGAINKASAFVESSATMLNALYEGVEASHRGLDERYGEAMSKIAILEQELSLTQEELRSERYTSDHLAYDAAARTGIDPDTVRDNIIKPKTPDVPDDADEMLAQFNVFNSFVKCDGIEHAFARYVYGDPRIGQTIREHADMKAKQRSDAVFGRDCARNMSKFLSQLGEWVRQERINWWHNEYPKLRRADNRKVRNVPRAVGSETCALAAMSRRAQPAIFRSIYYSRLGFNEDGYRSPVRNNAMAGALISMIKPVSVNYRRSEFKAGKYEAWWRRNIDAAELMCEQKMYPNRVAVVKAYNKLVDIGNIELNPAERKRKAAKMKELKAREHERNERIEQRKEAKLQRKKDKAQREHIRAMQRIAH